MDKAGTRSGRLGVTTVSACFAIAVLSSCLALPALAGVQFTGLDRALERNARALVKLASASCDTARWRIERLYDNADTQLRDALEALGYYAYTLDKSIVFADGECWTALFDVAVGEPVRIRRVSVDIGGDARDDARLRQDIVARAPAQESILNHGVYERYKKSLVTQLAGSGYLAAELSESRVTVDPSLTWADIVFRLSSGPRHSFGDVVFSEGILDAGLLKRYVPFEPGDPYDVAALSRMQESLRGSGYFDGVSIQAEPSADGEATVPVVVTLRPSKRRQYTLGAGYATDTGVQGRAGYTDRRRNSAGHQFNATLFASQVDSEASGAYRWPSGESTGGWVDVYAGFRARRTDTSRSDKSTLGLRLSRNRGRGWLETPYVDLSYEDFDVGELRETSKLLIPGIKWESTVGRSLRRLEAGHRISIDLRGAHTSLLSDTSFAQFTLSAKWIRSFGASTRLLARADLGATARREFDELPATVRFFTGGDTSVRGYDFETIGPVDDNGDVTGGSHLVTAGLELDRSIRGNWAIAAFVDSGSAFDDADIEFKTGVGLGLRWYSPFGPVRLDLAHPLDDDDTDVRVHLTLGPDL